MLRQQLFEPFLQGKPDGWITRRSTEMQNGKELGQGLEEVNLSFVLFSIVTGLRVAHP